MTALAVAVNVAGVCSAAVGGAVSVIGFAMVQRCAWSRWRSPLNMGNSRHW